MNTQARVSLERWLDRKAERDAMIAADSSCAADDEVQVKPVYVNPHDLRPCHPKRYVLGWVKS